jgi:hypothetical protein
MMRTRALMKVGSDAAMGDAMQVMLPPRHPAPLHLDCVHSTPRRAASP